MYRASIKIERLSTVSTRRPIEEPTADLVIQVKGVSPLDAINRAIRLLTSERDALLPALEPVPVSAPFDDEDEV